MVVVLPNTSAAVRPYIAAVHLRTSYQTHGCCTQVCEDLLERLGTISGTTDDKLELLKPFLKGLGKESAFPLLRLILPEVCKIYVD